MSELLSKSAYITKFFDQLESETKGQIEATYCAVSQIFTVHIFMHEYDWSIPEAQAFVIGWNVNNTIKNNQGPEHMGDIFVKKKITSDDVTGAERKLAYLKRQYLKDNGWIVTENWATRNSKDGRQGASMSVDEGVKSMIYDEENPPKFD